MHAVGIWCKAKIQIDPGGLEVNFSLQGTDISWHVPNRYLILSFSYVIIISVQPVFSDGIVICFSDFYTRG